MASRETKKDLKSAEELQKLRDALEREMLEKVLATYEGRHVLYSVLALADIYDLRTGPIPYDNAAAQRRLGRRDVGLEVLAQVLEVKPNVYIMMQQEAGTFEKQFEIEITGSEEQDHG